MFWQFALRRRVIAASIVIASLAFLSGAWRAGAVGASSGLQTSATATYRLQSSDAPPPQELSQAVREALNPDSLHVIGANGSFCHLWLRRDIPPGTTLNRGIGIAFPQLAVGTLIGAIRFESGANDYRNQIINPGVYTLRYDLQPTDGNHQGTAPFRDFLLLVPSSVDATPGLMKETDLLDASRKTTGTTHPAILSLVPAENAPVAIPALTHVAEGDLWVLFFRAAVPAAAASPGPTVMGLVIAGHAAENH